MLGIYLFAAILGGGLLLFSMIGGGDHDAAHGDASGLDAGHDVGHDVGHDSDVAHHGTGAAGELLLGLFRPRNLIFFLAAFGVTGTLLSLIASPSVLSGLIPSVAMGLAAMVMTHGVFVWLRRSESAVDVVGDAELEGGLGRVTLPLTPGALGRIACRVRDREVHMVARLAAGYDEALVVGREVVILRIADAVAEVMPFESRELPPSTD